MELLPQHIIDRFAEIGDQSDNTTNPIVVAQFVARKAKIVWYATTYDSLENFCFGYVEGLPNTKGEGEWGWFSIDDLERSIIPPYEEKVERNEKFVEARLDEVIRR